MATIHAVPTRFRTPARITMLALALEMTFGTDCHRPYATEATSDPADQPSAPASRASAPATSASLADWPPAFPASAERVEERLRMVETQIARPRDGRDPVRDTRVLEAMRRVPRHAFVPADVSRLAYRDSPLPIGHEQTISQPYIVALMTELLNVEPGARILEVGTGSGYQAAVLACLTPHVWTIEIVEPLARRAEKALREQGCTTVRVRQGDGYLGWPEAAPFDGIIVTCAADRLPEPLWQQLRPGGRIVIPTGQAWGVQELVVVSKTPDGRRETRTVIPVRFVPMTRE